MITIYVLRSFKNGVHYVGMTENIQRRLIEHNAGKSKFTSGHTPWEIIYTEMAENFIEGRIREKYLKTSAGKKFYLKVIEMKFKSISLEESNGSLPA